MLCSDPNTSLPFTSNEFGGLEYKLQLSLNASTAKVLSASYLANPNQQIQFDKKSRELLTLDCWICPEDLCGVTNDKEIVRKLSSTLLELPDSKGVQLLHGRLKEKEIVAFRNAGKPNQFKLVSCKVIVGRSLAMPSVDEAKKAQLPVGYDSFYLHDTGISADANNSTDTHRYIIKSAWQVLPQYLVVFEFDPAVERRSRESFRCDNCETALAEFHCAADAANLCKECDVLLHSSSKIAQRHRRVPIEKAIDALGCCRYHEFQRIEFFCTQCLKAVCVHCKMVGHHSGPETAHHRLVGIAEAFDSIMEESKANDSILDSRKNLIQNQIQSLKSRAKQVVDQRQQMEHDIELVYRKALEQLHMKTEEKLLVLLSDELELHRQQKELVGAEKFLEYQQTAVDVYPLLLNWVKHQELQQKMREFGYFRDKIDVDADLKITGTLEITQSEVQYKSVKKERSQPPIAFPENTKSIPLTARRTSELFSEALSNGLVIN